MQVIFTKYIGPSNFKGARIIATASGNKVRAIVSYDSALSSEDAHLNGVKALCGKLNWSGKLVAGHTKDGMVWVFDEVPSVRATVQK
jgi:hypothetical protein